MTNKCRGNNVVWGCGGSSIGSSIFFIDRTGGFLEVARATDYRSTGSVREPDLDFGKYLWRRYCSAAADLYRCALWISTAALPYVKQAALHRLGVFHFLIQPPGEHQG